LGPVISKQLGHPIAFFGRKLTSSQRNYSTIKNEFYLVLRPLNNTVPFSKAPIFEFTPIIQISPSRTFVPNAFATGKLASKSYVPTLSTSLAKSRLPLTFYHNIPSSRRQ
jgi:hypothetical protein